MRRQLRGCGDLRGLIYPYAGEWQVHIWYNCRNRPRLCPHPRKSMCI